MNFATVTTAPHLPFADGYFDFAYCSSVFTHISDLADAWLLELRRIVRSGGTSTSPSATTTLWTSSWARGERRAETSAQ